MSDTDARPRTYGAQSMTAPLLDVVIKRPGPAFGSAFDDPRHGFRHRVDLPLAQREHDAFADLLSRLGARVHELGVETSSPDLTYTFDPLLVTDRGAIPLRSGKPNRVGEESALEAWTLARGIPTVGRIEAPATVDGGDTFWLRPDLFCIGRSLRTNRAGSEQLAALVGGDVRVFDVAYGDGPEECLHLLSVISPVADDLAVVFLPLLPAGLYELVRDLGIRLLPCRRKSSPRSAAMSSRCARAWWSSPPATRPRSGCFVTQAARSTSTMPSRSVSMAAVGRPA